jgi:hypothetical protein
MEQTARTPTRGSATSLAGEAILTLVAMCFVWLALDDITTDNAVGFRPEYTLLACAGAWLLFFVARLWRSGRRSLAGVSLLFLLAAIWVAGGGIGHRRDGGWNVYWFEYSTLAAAWLWFTGLGAVEARHLLDRRVPRSAPRPL